MIRSFNYLPPSGIVLPRETIAAISAYAGMLAYPALAIVLVIFAFGFEQFRIATVNSDHAALAAQELALSRQRAAMLAVKDTDTDAVIPLLPQISEIRSSGERAADSIALLGSIAPPHVWFDSITGDNNGTQTIVGGAPTLKAVSNFVTDIEKSLVRVATVQSIAATRGRSVYLNYTISVAPGAGSKS